jgi:hypothetical protein
MARAGSTAVWLLPGWSCTFERNVFLWRLFVATPLSIACGAYSGLAWGVAFFVGFWPFPYRTRWTREGLDVSWLFLRERLPLVDIHSARLRSNVRRSRIFCCGLVLDLELVDGKRVTLTGPQRTIQALHAQIAAALPASPA